MAEIRQSRGRSRWRLRPIAPRACGGRPAREHPVETAVHQEDRQARSFPHPPIPAISGWKVAETGARWVGRGGVEPGDIAERAAVVCRSQQTFGIDIPAASQVHGGYVSVRRVRRRRHQAPGRARRGRRDQDGAKLRASRSQLHRNCGHCRCRHATHHQRPGAVGCVIFGT